MTTPQSPNLDSLKYYLLKPGFSEDSVLYEVKLKEVERMPRATADEIVDRLEKRGAKRLIIDAGYPSMIERLKLHFVINKIMRLVWGRKWMS